MSSGPVDETLFPDRSTLPRGGRPECRRSRDLRVESRSVVEDSVSSPGGEEKTGVSRGRPSRHSPTPHDRRNRFATVVYGIGSRNDERPGAPTTDPVRPSWTDTSRPLTRRLVPPTVTRSRGRPTGPGVRSPTGARRGRPFTSLTTDVWSAAVLRGHSSPGPGPVRPLSPLRFPLNRSPVTRTGSGGVERPSRGDRSVWVFPSGSFTGCGVGDCKSGVRKDGVSVAETRDSHTPPKTTTTTKTPPTNWVFSESGFIGTILQSHVKNTTLFLVSYRGYRGPTLS